MDGCSIGWLVRNGLLFQYNSGSLYIGGRSFVTISVALSLQKLLRFHCNNGCSFVILVVALLL